MLVGSATRFILFGVTVFVALVVILLLCVYERPRIVRRHKVKRRRSPSSHKGIIKSDSATLFGALIHNTSHPLYTNLRWNTQKDISSLKTPLNGELLNDSCTYDAAFARVAINAIMLTYNMTRKDSEPAPSPLTPLRRIGESGYYFMWRGVHIVAFRGTTSNSDVVTDINFVQCPYESPAIQRNDVYIHAGFYLWWQQHSYALRSLIKELDAKETSSTLMITGHSMGAAVAALAALDSATSLRPIGLYTFAAPQVGNASFYEELTKRVIPYHSVENYRDVVTQMPPPVASTFSTNYYYDHAPLQARVVYNFETGSLAGNHHLDAYGSAIDTTSLPAGWLWNRGMNS